MQERRRHHHHNEGHGNQLKPQHQTRGEADVLVSHKPGTQHTRRENSHQHQRRQILRASKEILDQHIGIVGEPGGH